MANECTYSINKISTNCIITIHTTQFYSIFILWCNHAPKSTIWAFLFSLIISSIKSTCYSFVYPFQPFLLILFLLVKKKPLVIYPLFKYLPLVFFLKFGSMQMMIFFNRCAVFSQLCKSFRLDNILFIFTNANFTLHRFLSPISLPSSHLNIFNFLTAFKEPMLNYKTLVYK